MTDSWTNTAIGTRAMTVDLCLHNEIKRRLKVAGSSLTEVSRQLGVSPSTVTVVSQGYRRSGRIQAEIAQTLGTTAEALFPDRYPTQEDANMTIRRG